MAKFHDVSTKRGFLKQIWFRWKYVLLLTLLGVGIIFGASLAVRNNVLKSATDEVPESTFTLLGSTLVYHGDESKFDGRHLDHFPDLPPSSAYETPIDKIELKWVRIHGPNFTAQLAEYASTLKVLHLNNITIEDHLQPLSLPLLKEFYLVQGLQPEERNAPEYSLARGPTPWLSSTLFFLNDNASDFDANAAKAYRKGVNVTIFLKGSIAYQLNPGFNEVRLDISNCSGILRKLPQTYKILTLGRCRDLTPTLINPEITFLNFYIVYVTNELLSGILRNLRKLEEFYAEIPDGNVTVKLDDFSKTLKILSVSSMAIIPGARPLPNVKEFYFGAENQYGWLESRVTTLNQSLFMNFAKIFPKVEKVGLFDIQDDERYVFLGSVLKTPSVKWIIVENFGRGGNTTSTSNSTDLTIEDKAFEFVELELTSLSLPEDAVDFIIEGQKPMRTAREITKLEKLWYRYTYLGWCPIDSWPKFLYVQMIIEEGGLLG